MLRAIRVAGNPGFHFPRNGVCAGHAEIPLNNQRSGWTTPSLQLSYWPAPGWGRHTGKHFYFLLFPAGCSLKPHSESAPPCQTSSNSSLWKSSTCTDVINRNALGTRSLFLPQLWSWWTLCQHSSQLHTSHWCWGISISSILKGKNHPPVPGISIHWNVCYMNYKCHALFICKTQFASNSEVKTELELKKSSARLEKSRKMNLSFSF